MDRPDTPLAETPKPKPYSDFSPYERKIMDSMKKDKRFAPKKLSDDEMNALSDMYGGNPVKKIYDKLGMNYKNRK
jgi:hypothetical protein